MKQDYITIASREFLLNNSAFSECRTEEDRRYITKFKNLDRQKITLAMRNLTRQVISNFTNSMPQDWKIKINQTEGRFAISEEGQILNLSFTHSPKWIGIAISPNPVGIDIEECREMRPWPEMISFLELPNPAPKIESEVTFLRYWTEIEAKFKFASASPDQPARFSHHYNIDPNTTLCLVSNSKSYTLKKWHLTF